MTRIHSANPDFQPVEVADYNTNYPHPAEVRKGAIPLAFQVTSPFDKRRVLMPHALVLHVNPTSLQETHNQKKEVIQTRGGFVEQHWGHDLVELSADQSTGAFMNIYTGLTSVLRQRTIAWDRYRDLHDLFLNNGSVYDPFGNIVLQGHIMLMYDRGTFVGTFRSFDVDESDDSPFAFALSWSFKIEQTILSVSADITAANAPVFQQQNVLIPGNAPTAEQVAEGEGLKIEAKKREAEAKEREAEVKKREKDAIETAKRGVEFAKGLIKNDPMDGHWITE
jgi:hypothetical protein